MMRASRWLPVVDGSPAPTYHTQALNSVRYSLPPQPGDANKGGANHAYESQRVPCIYWE